MRRREFIALLGSSAVAWPLAARAQQAAMPVIGFLHPASPSSPGPYVAIRASFLRGLQETDYVGDQNVTIEYRWAEGQYDRLPELAADLARRQVAVLFVGGGPAAIWAARSATSTIPIVFVTGDDPLRHGVRGQPQSAGRQCHRCKLLHDRSRLEACRVGARSRAQCVLDCVSREPGQSGGGARNQRRERGSARARIPAPRAERQQRTRDRRRLCDANSVARRGADHRLRSVPVFARESDRRAGRPSRGSGDLRLARKCRGRWACQLTRILTSPTNSAHVRGAEQTGANMPATLLQPGVYIEEIPSGVRTITGVATSIALFIGWAPRGPLDRAVRLTSFADYERAYGGLDQRSLLGYSVRHFFDNGGSDAYIIRLASTDPADPEPGSRVTGAGAYMATCAVTHPRQEPYAGKPHVRICAGGVR